MDATCLNNKQANGNNTFDSTLFASEIPLKEQSIQGKTLHSANFKNHAIIFRAGFVFISIMFGALSAWNSYPEHWQAWIAWGISGGALGIGVIAFAHIINRFPTSNILQIAQSLSIGIVMASLFSWLMTIIFPSSTALVSSLSLASLLTFPYIAFTVRHQLLRDTLLQQTYPWHLENHGPYEAPTKIIDTSAIIDGRILDLCETGFVEGPLLIPKFVLGELHNIADSHHSWRRARGKRGLEILAQLQKVATIQIHIIEEDFPDVAEVDHKLVRLAQQCQAKIITNDWNLTKVASLQGVQYLNVNQLSHQLKPPVLPGEIIRVYINKEGDLAGQGVAHLDDGTMVVVDQARDYIRETVDVMITKFMQTHSGRILFGARL